MADTEAIVHVLPPREHRFRQISIRRLAIAFLMLAPLASGFLSVFLGQDANWDLRNYHWYNPYALLHHRFALDLLPAQTPTFYNPTLDIPFYLLATSVPARAAGFALGFVQGLNTILLFMLAYVSLIIPNPRHKVISCAAIATLGLLGGGGIAMLGTTFYDNVTSLGVLLSALLVLRHFQRLMSEDLTRSLGRIFLFALPSGLMVGLKLPAAIFCSGFCIAILFMPGQFQRRFLLTAAFGMGVLVGALFSLGPWALFLNYHYGNPLFPYFNGFFKSPLAPLVSGRDTEFIPSTVSDFLFYPFIFTKYPLRVGEIPWRDLRIACLYLILPLAVLARLFFGRNKSHVGAIATHYATRYLLWAGVISYVIWLLFFCIYRYLVPLEMEAPLLITLTIGLLPTKPNTRAFFITALLLVIAATIEPGNWFRRSSWLDHYIEAQIPPLGDTSNLMLLMAGFEPYSHIVTQFPPEVPVVRIQSNFASPNQDKGINKVVRERIEAHEARMGRFLMLIPPWQHEMANDALSFFNLALKPGACQKVLDRLYDDMALDLCAVQTTPPDPKVR